MPLNCLKTGFVIRNWLLTALVLLAGCAGPGVEAPAVAPARMARLVLLLPVSTRAEFLHERWAERFAGRFQTEMDRRDLPLMTRFAELHGSRLSAAARQASAEVNASHLLLPQIDPEWLKENPAKPWADPMPIVFVLYDLDRGQRVWVSRRMFPGVGAESSAADELARQLEAAGWLTGAGR